MCDRGDSSPVRCHEERQLQLRVSLKQPQQSTQCALLQIAAGFVSVSRSAGKHVVDGHEAIADWFAGSALRPFLELLSDDERCAFIGRYRDGLRDAYPAQPDGNVLFAYPRLFMVAVSAGRRL